MSAGWGTLDYAGAKITIRTVSKWESGFRAHSCAKEPWTVAWIDSINPDGAVLWDIGANTGPYALIAGSRGIRTYAFEPGYNNYAALCDNSLGNPASAHLICPLNLALSDSTELVPFYYRDLEPGAASHGFGVGSGKMVAQLPAVAMTAFFAINVMNMAQPTHLKIDVDGAEFRVLVGFGDRLDLVKEIMIELPNEGHALESIRSLLKAHGFTLAQTYTERDGHAIGQIHYELHVRRE